MITAHDMNWHPDAVLHDASDPDHFAVNQHRLMDGKLYAPADNLKLGYEGAAVDQPCGAGLLFISIGDVGICSALPPPQPARPCGITHPTRRHGRRQRQAFGRRGAAKGCR